MSYSTAGHVETAGYDKRMGTITSVTDRNGNVTSAAYDAFGRLLKIAKPGDTLAAPTIDLSYSSAAGGQPFKYQIQRCVATETGVTLADSIQMYDGMGRNIQEKRESLDGST